VTTAQRAANAYNNLISGFWAGSIGSGQFVSRSPYQGGYVTPTSPAQPTSSNPWEYAQACTAAYAMWLSSNQHLNGDAGWRLGQEVRALRAAFPDKTWNACGAGSALYAVDDCAWTCLLFLEYFDVTNDNSVLPIVARIINAALARWLDDTTGGGLWYDDARTEKSSYQAALVYAMYWYQYASGQWIYQNQIDSIYNWALTKLARADGGWWEGVGPDGVPLRKSTPYQINLSNSVTYLAGNMFWSAVAGLQNYNQPSQAYVNQMNLTASFMLKYETIRGRWMNDRDPATDAAGAHFYAEYVVPQLSASNQTAIKAAYTATATAIDPKATNTFEQFSSDWLAGSFIGCTAVPNDACNNLPVFANIAMWAIVAQRWG
jgi:hypothetical protein